MCGNLILWYVTNLKQKRIFYRIGCLRNLCLWFVILLLFHLCNRHFKSEKPVENSARRNVWIQLESEVIIFPLHTSVIVQRGQTYSDCRHSVLSKLKSVKSINYSSYFVCVFFLIYCCLNTWKTFDNVIFES